MHASASWLECQLYAKKRLTDLEGGVRVYATMKPTCSRPPVRRHEIVLERATQGRDRSEVALPGSAPSSGLFLSLVLACLLAPPCLRAAVLVDVGGGDVEPNGSVSVPVTVSGFGGGNLTSLNFTLSWNATWLSYAGLENVTLPNLTSGNLAYDAETPTLAMNWFDGTGSSTDPSGFNIIFNASGGAGGSAALAFVTSPTPQEVSVDFGSQNDALWQVGAIDVVPEPTHVALALFASTFVSWNTLRWWGRRQASRGRSSRR